MSEGIREYTVDQPPTSQEVFDRAKELMLSDSTMHLVLKNDDDGFREADMEVWGLHGGNRRVTGKAKGMATVVIQLAADLKDPATASVAWDADIE